MNTPTPSLAEKTILQLQRELAAAKAENAKLKAENSKLRSALELVHFKQEQWQ